MIFPISKLKEEFYYWDIIRDMVDQCIDIALNLSQSGHPGGSRSKVPVLIATLLSGVMKWDIRNPGKIFGDRFILVAGHTNPVVYATLAVFNEALINSNYIIEEIQLYSKNISIKHCINKKRYSKSNTNIK